MNNTFQFGAPFRMMDISSHCMYLIVPIEAYVFPILSLIVCVFNILAVFVFLQKRVRSHTTFILTLIAVTDMLNILFPTYFCVYYYTLGNYKDFVTFQMCFLTYILGSVSVEFFNALSLWLTVLLAYIRCRCLKDPFNAHTFHTSKKITIYVTFILIFTAIAHLPSLLLFEFSPKSSIVSTSNQTKQLCVIKESNLVFHNSSLGRKIQFSTETVLDSIVPCFVLVYLDFMILLTLKEASRSRSSLRRRNSKIQIHESNKTGNNRKHLQIKFKSKALLLKSKRTNKELDNKINKKTTADTSDDITKILTVNTELVNRTQSCSNLSEFGAKCKLFEKKNTESVDSAFDRLDKESRRTSWLILMVATIISLHEIPLAIYNVYVLVKHAGVSLPLDVYGCSSVILLLWQYITYLVIFLIYAFMSGAFRTELKRVLGKICNVDSFRSAGKKQVFLSPCSIHKTISRDRASTFDHTIDSDSEAEI